MDVVQQRFRRSLFVAAIVVELTLIALLLYHNVFYFHTIYLGVPLILFLLIEPVSFFPSSLSFDSRGVVHRMGKRVVDVVLKDDSFVVERRLLLFLIPVVSIASGNTRILLSIRNRGVVPFIEHCAQTGAISSHLAAQFQADRDELMAQRDLWQMLTRWFQWFPLFAIVTPVLIWESAPGTTLLWVSVSFLFPVGIALIGACIHRTLFALVPLRVLRGISTVRFWVMLVVFAGYLLVGTLIFR